MRLGFNPSKENTAVLTKKYKNFWNLEQPFQPLKGKYGRSDDEVREIADACDDRFNPSKENTAVLTPVIHSGNRPSISYHIYPVCGWFAPLWSCCSSKYLSLYPTGWHLPRVLIHNCKNGHISSSINVNQRDPITLFRPQLAQINLNRRFRGSHALIVLVLDSDTHRWTLITYKNSVHYGHNLVAN